MNPQSPMAGATGRRQALDQLGDLFFGASGQRRPPQQPALDDLLARPIPTPDPHDSQTAMPAAVVTAFLTGGLPPERRLVLAREAIARLGAACGRTALVTFDGDRAIVAALGCGDDQDASPTSSRVDHFSDAIRAADRLTIVLADGAASFLESGRRLPDHCVVLTLSDPESMVEAYRELKAATAATAGPVPDIFVLEADSRDQAERTYRRLSRVAISHLGCTPTFAGHVVGKGHTASLGPTGRVFDQLDAEIVYRTLQPMLQTRAAAAARPERTEPSRPQPVVRPAEPQAGLRQTLPPVAGVVEADGRQATRSGAFAVWQPESRDDVLRAAAMSLESLLPGLRGVIDVRAEVAGEETECPDLVAVDREGRPVAILLAEANDPAALVRAARCRTWLAAYGRLLRRAFPDAGLTAESPTAACMVLAADETIATLRSLCPPDVRLVGYLPLACGSVRGLLLRDTNSAANTVIGTVCERKSASAAVALTAAPSASVQPSAGEMPAVADRPAMFPASDIEALDDSSAARGTSPDDDLSADELSDLRTGFEIDELT